LQQRRGWDWVSRGAEPIETFLEAALFEMVRRPAFAQFLTRRSAVPDRRIALLSQVRAVEALQQKTLWPTPLRSLGLGGAARLNTS
jgi:hypothetical protein